MFKKLFIYFFLIHTLLLTSSLADRWILVSTSVGDTIKVYIDKKNIRSNGNTVVWWQLDSYKEKLPESEHTIFSNIAKTEGDCLRDGRKDLYIAFYDQKMGKGNKVLEINNPDEEWTYNKPGSVYFKALRYACENK